MLLTLIQQHSLQCIVGDKGDRGVPGTSGDKGEQGEQVRVLHACYSTRLKL